MKAIYLFLEKSKNDQERVGHTTLIAPGVGSRIAPLEQIERYLLRIEAHPDAKFFFHSSKKPYKGLSPTTPNSILKKMLVRIGVDPGPYGSHSCRRGGATAAAFGKVSKRVLKRHGNWRSDAVDIYIGDDAVELLSCSEAILAAE